MPDEPHELGETLDRRRAAARFSHDLVRAFSAMGIKTRRVSDHPEEWRAGRLTLRVDRRRDQVTLRYGRAPIGPRLSCDADEVIRAHQRTLETLECRSLAPSVLHGVLYRAYQTVLRRAGARDGEPVRLSDLFPQVAELAREQRTPKTAYTRAQFAYDLARLKREHKLAHNGARIDLGVATGDATSRKRQVFWIENDAGGGHYYASFRIIPHESRSGDCP